MRAHVNIFELEQPELTTIHNRDANCLNKFGFQRSPFVRIWSEIEIWHDMLLRHDMTQNNQNRSSDKVERVGSYQFMLSPEQAS